MNLTVVQTLSYCTNIDMLPLDLSVGDSADVTDRDKLSIYTAVPRGR